MRPEGAAFRDCIENGGVAVFPADTVYGLACDPANDDAVARLYALKGRAPDKPSATMWFDRDAALAALPDLGPRTRAACEGLLPGAVTLVLPGGLGIRVPRVPLLAGVPCAVLQSSANFAGGPDARTIEEIPSAIRDGADLVLDGGLLPGTPSTVIDLTRWEGEGDWKILRAGAVSDGEVAKALAMVSGPP